MVEIEIPFHGKLVLMEIVLNVKKERKKEKRTLDFQDDRTVDNGVFYHFSIHIMLSWLTHTCLDNILVPLSQSILYLLNDVLISEFESSLYLLDSINFFFQLWWKEKLYWSTNSFVIAMYNIIDRLDW